MTDACSPKVVQCANLSAVSIDLEANTHEQTDGEEREPGLGEGGDRVRKDGGSVPYHWTISA